MDITKELKEIDLNNENINKFVKDIEFQQHELLKKAHLLKVVNFANEVEKLIKTNIFFDYNIYFFEAYWDRPIGSSNIKLSFLIQDKSKKRMNVIDESNLLIKPFAKISGLVDQLNWFKPEFIKQSALELTLEDIIIEIKPGIKDKILDILLSNELKSILNYNKMQNELVTSHLNIDKKFKM